MTFDIFTLYFGDMHSGRRVCGGGVGCGGGGGGGGGGGRK